MTVPVTTVPEEFCTEIRPILLEPGALEVPAVLARRPLNTDTWKGAELLELLLLLLLLKLNLMLQSCPMV